MKKFTALALSLLSAIAIGIPAYSQGAYYPLNGNANDLSGNGNNGTVSGATSRPDRGNNANACYEFDGVNDNIVVPDANSLDITTNTQTIAFWFQLCQIPAANDGNEYYMISKLNGTTNHGWHVFMRRDMGDGFLKIIYRGLNSGNFAAQNYYEINIDNVQLGSWNYVVFRVGAAPNGPQTMLNNTAWGWGSFVTPIAQNNLNLVIGGGVHVWAAPSDRYFGLGRMDEIRLYDRYLTPAEVTNFYNQIPTNTFNQPVVISNNNGLCLNHDSLIITATSQPGLSYSWTGPNSDSYSTNQIVIENPTAANDGLYTLNTNYQGCPRPQQTVTITPPLPPLALTGPTQVCTGTPFSYSVPANALATFTWDTPGAGTPAANTFSNPSASAAEAGDYSLTYSLNNCIGVSDTITLNVVQQYTVTVYDTICQGQSIVLGGAPQTLAGAYQDLYQTTSGCDSLVTTQLFVKPLPQVDLGPDRQSCVGSTVTLNATTNGTIIDWSTGAGPVNSINVTTTDEYWVEAELNGCSNRDTVEVDFYLNPAATFTANNVAQCLAGNSFDFSPTNAFAPGSTFDWAFTGALTPTSAANNPTGVVWDADGNFAVTLTVTENNCISQPSTLNITVYPQPVADFVAIPQQGCEPVEVKFNNTTQSLTPYTAAWVLGDGNNAADQSPAHTYQQAGSYNVTLTVTDANGCMDTETKPGFITVYPQPVAGFTLTNTELTTTEPQLEVLDASSQSTACFYYLSDGTAWTDCSFTANVAGTGVFTITQVVTSGAGCIDSTSQQFTVRPKPEIFVPNTFTPNGDYMNERFEPSLSWIGDYYLIIYDRWGGIVFETDDPFTYWNGKLFNYGKELPQDVYAYRLRYQPYQQDKNFFLTGSVTLVR